MRWLAPKAPSGTFPLLNRLNEAPVIPIAIDLTARSGTALGIDTEWLAYFALSLVWRAAVHDWAFPDGSKSTRLVLGSYEEQIRGYLLGDSPFPAHALLFRHMRS